MKSDYYTSEDLRSLGIAKVGNNVLISRDTVITGLENIRIGNNVRIDSFNIILAQRGILQVGNNVHIEPSSSIVAHFGIFIGDYCTISHGVRLFTASANYDGHFFTNVFPDPKYQSPYSGSIKIEDHVIIGGNSVVMPNLTIAQGAAIGALSFVRSSVEGWAIYGGNPLTRIRSRDKEIESIGNQLKAIGKFDS